MRKLFIAILLFYTGMTRAQQALAEYDFSGMMGPPERTYLATFYDDHVRFDVSIPEKNWTLTAITDDYERQMFIRLLNCTRNLEYRKEVLKDYLDSFDYLWRNPKYHKQHKEYFEVNEGFMEEFMDNAMSYHTPKSYLTIWNELQEMEQAEKREIESARKKARDERAKEEVGTVLMAAIMARMLGGFLGGGNGDEFNGQRFNNEAEMEDYKTRNGYK